MLIFDAFARVSESDELAVSWPGVQLDAEQIALIDSFADKLGFLGRAESWVEARRLESWGGKLNCVPANTATESEENERLTLMTPMPAADYAGFRAAKLEGLAKRSDLKPKDKKAIDATLPESWLDAIGVETAHL